MAGEHVVKSNDHEVWYSSDTGVSIRERVGNTIVTYNDHTGNVETISVRIPKFNNTDAEKDVYLYLEPNTADFREAEERVASQLTKRMKNANWPKLEKTMDASAFRELKERYDTELRKEEEARKKGVGLETNSENKENVISASKKSKREYKYNEFGGIQSESLEGITLEFDEFGKPINGAIQIPFNPDGNNPGGSGAPIIFSCDGNGIYDLVVKNFPSPNYNRMHNTDWGKLEEYAKANGEEKKLKEAQERYEEGKPGLVERARVNVEEAVEKGKEMYNKNIASGLKSIAFGLKEMGNDLKQLVSGDEKEQLVSGGNKENQPDSSGKNQTPSNGNSGGDGIKNILRHSQEITYLEALRLPEERTTVQSTDDHNGTLKQNSGGRVPDPSQEDPEALQKLVNASYKQK